MTDDEVFQHRLERIGKPGDFRDLLMQHLQLKDHVTKKLAAGGIGERAIVGQLVDLANVMQKRAAKKKVAVDLGIVLADQVAGARKGYDVVGQAPDVGMMKTLRCRRVTAGSGYLWC